MKTIYAVQRMYNFTDDTINLFTSKKKAIEYINITRKYDCTNHKEPQIKLKKFDLTYGWGTEMEIELPF